MTIRILCIGKLKERFYADAVTEFVKRLSRYAAVEIVELADERAPEQLSPAQREQVKSAEGRRMLARIGEGEFLVALDQRGAELSSEQLAAHMQSWMGRGQKPHCVCHRRLARPFCGGARAGGFPPFLWKADIFAPDFPHHAAGAGLPRLQDHERGTVS